MPGTALTSLSHHIDLDWMREAYRLTRKDGADGIDGQDAEAFAENLEENLQELLDEAKSGRYRAPAVRRVPGGVWRQVCGVRSIVGQVLSGRMEPETERLRVVPDAFVQGQHDEAGEAGACSQCRREMNGIERAHGLQRKRPAGTLDDLALDAEHVPAVQHGPEGRETVRRFALRQERPMHRAQEAPLALDRHRCLICFQ